MTAVAGWWRYRGLIRNLAVRELKIRYKKSLLGWLWSLINPASTLIIYTFVFGYFLKIEPPVGLNSHLKSFALFLFAGLITWNFFASVVTGSIGWLMGAGGLLKKIYFPPETPLVAGTLTVLTQTGVEAAILTSVLLVLGKATPVLLLAPLMVAILLAFALGVGLLVSVLNVYYRDVSHLVAIGMNLLFYATPIIYPYSFVPARVGWLPVRQIVRFNPLTQFVGAFRDLFYDLRVPSPGRIGAVIVAAGATLTVGWLVFRHYAPDLSEEL
jgi:ABC-2 type transport system permease protein